MEAEMVEKLSGLLSMSLPRPILLRLPIPPSNPYSEAHPKSLLPYPFAVVRQSIALYDFFVSSSSSSSALFDAIFRFIKQYTAGTRAVVPTVWHYCFILMLQRPKSQWKKQKLLAALKDVRFYRS